VLRKTSCTALNRGIDGKEVFIMAFTQRKILFFNLIIIFLSATIFAQTYVPLLINFQGKLSDPETGEILPDGQYNITFRIYENITGVQPIWEETQVVNVRRGIFNVILGSVQSLEGVFNETERYIGISIGGGDELLPRQRMVSVPYSFISEFSNQCIEADTLDGMHAEDISRVGTLGASGQWCTTDGNQVNCTSPEPVMSESDPVFSRSAASGISSTNINNWNAAYSWGNHANAGYLTSYNESDPTVPDSIKDGISWSEISNIPPDIADGDDVGTGNTLWSQSGNNIYYNNGNVGIGTTSPGARLHVIESNSTVVPSIIKGPDHRVLNIAADWDGATLLLHEGRPRLHFVEENQEGGISFDGDGIRMYSGRETNVRMFIGQSAGNVGIGTTSPTEKLHVVGNIYATGSITQGSSIEYKENIRELDINDAIQAIKKLNPVRFNYKGDKNEEHIGFIAEDVPQLLATKDRKGINTMDIVSVMVKVMQEQQKTIEELKRQMRELKRQIKR
jgi:hypothetical protein